MRLIPYRPFQISLPNFFGDQDIFDSQFLQMPSIRVDVRESADEGIVEADIPGLERKEDVQISVHDNHLHLSGEIRRESEQKDENTYHTERYVGRFARTISLPALVDEESAKAVYRNGVLEIRLGKTKRHTGRNIDVDFLS